MKNWVRVGGASVALALALTACAASDRDAGGGATDEATSEGRDTFIFAASAVQDRGQVTLVQFHDAVDLAEETRAKLSMILVLMAIYALF